MTIVATIVATSCDCTVVVDDLEFVYVVVLCKDV